MLKGERKFTSVVLAVLTVLASLLILVNRADAEEIADREIVDAVKLQIQYDEIIDYDNLAVDVRDGIVILKGDVNTLLAKERLIEAVENIKGHKGFVDLVKVAPDNVFPDTILTLKIENHILEDPVTDSYEISVKVMDGTVVLDGTVDSYMEKIQAENIAKNVEGVEKVESSIEIVYPTKRLDSEMKSEIVTAIKNDIRVDAYLLDVKVENAIAKISGIVGSEEARKRLRAKAWVYGIKDVDVKQVSTKDWAHNKMQQPSEFKLLGDKELQERIQTAMTFDPRVFSFDIEVEVKSPFVTLRGNVTSKEARMAAEEDAMNIRGVISVNNLIKVKSHEAVPTDNKLVESVKNTLLSDTQGSYANVDILASKGWVYLSGNMKTEYLKERAEQLIMSRLSGVLEIQNSLVADYTKNTLPDWIIEANIRTRLYENPFINSSRIIVDLDDGLVTLDGKVQNFTEFDIAENIAYQSGAKAVVNNMTVTTFAYSPTAKLENAFTVR